MEKVLLEYAQEAELVEVMPEGKYKVRITKKNEVTEKIVGYKPLPLDGWKYADGTMVRSLKDGLFYRLKRYTTYCRDGLLIYAYTKYGVKRYSDGMVYEFDLDSEYVIDQGTFLSYTGVRELIEKRDEDTFLHRDAIRQAKLSIADAEKAIREIEKTYDIESLCAHDWEEAGEEVVNDGRTTKKMYTCGTCEKEDVHHWHKVF